MRNNNQKSPIELGQIIADLSINDLRAAREDGYRMRRNYSGKRKIQKPEYARFKCQIKFLDGNTRYFYSMDTFKHQGHTYRDEWRGFSALIFLIESWVLEGKVKQARIFVNLEDRRPRTDQHNYNQMAWNGWINRFGNWTARDCYNCGFEVHGLNNLLALQVAA